MSCAYESMHRHVEIVRINFKLKVEKVSINGDEKKLEPTCPTDSSAITAAVESTVQVGA